MKPIAINCFPRQRKMQSRTSRPTSVCKNDVYACLVRWRLAVNLTTAGEDNGVGTGRSMTDQYPSNWAIENPRSLNLPFSDDRFTS